MARSVLIGTPNVTFVGDHWTPPDTSALPPTDPMHRMPMSDLDAAPDAIARVAPAARAIAITSTAPVPPSPAPASTRPTSAPPSASPAAARSGGAYVYASWYGPGFYGNRTACGQTFTPASWGIAHKTLRCGTMVQITYRGQAITAPVIDRGPYVAGREVDLAAAVATALGFTGVQQIYLVIP